MVGPCKNSVPIVSIFPIKPKISIKYEIQGHQLKIKRDNIKNKAATLSMGQWKSEWASEINVCLSGRTNGLVKDNVCKVK